MPAITPFPTALRPAWDTGRTSILSFVDCAIVHGREPSDCDLPDEDEFTRNLPFSLAPGIPLPAPPATRSAVDLAHLLRQALLGRQDAFQQLYDVIVDHGCPDRDTVERALASDVGSHKRRLALALFLLQSSPDRNPVKLSLAMISALKAGRSEPARSLISTLGRHEEFTITALDTIAGCKEMDPANLLTMARHVRGWARIHLVERLAETEDPLAGHWILHEGYQNAIEPIYTSFVAAMAGNLDQALEDEGDDILVPAAEILSSLCHGGLDDRDLSDWEGGYRAVHRFMARIGSAEPRSSYILAVSHIHDYASYRIENEDFHPPWDERSCRGLVDACEDWLRHRSDAIRSMIVDGRSFDAARGTHAASVAAIDIFDELLDRQVRQPREWHLHILAQNASSKSRMQRLVDAVSQIHDLSAIPSHNERYLPGARRPVRFHWTQELASLLAALGEYPGIGPDVVAAGLASPVPKCRYLAARTLLMWGADNVPPDLLKDLWSAATQETDGKASTTMKIALKTLSSDVCETDPLADYTVGAGAAAASISRI